MEERLQWHAGFQAVIQIELEEDQEALQFLPEYNLTKKPLQIDTLIIKKKPGWKIQKKLGKLFREHNIVEYKSPEDYLSVNDYYKVLAYAGLYQSDTKKILEIRPEEITITFVCGHYPEKLVEYLKEQYNTLIIEEARGIYYLTGLTFPTQVIVNYLLEPEENVWLSRLRDNLKAGEDVRALGRAYKGKENNPNYEAALDLIMRANEGIYKEETMCDALKELFELHYDKIMQSEREAGREEGVAMGREEGVAVGRAEGVAAGRTEGEMRNKIDLICKKLRKGKSAEEIAEILEEDPGETRRICQTAAPFAPEYDLEKVFCAYRESVMGKKEAGERE